MDETNTAGSKTCHMCGSPAGNLGNHAEIKHGEVVLRIALCSPCSSIEIDRLARLHGRGIAPGLVAA